MYLGNFGAERGCHRLDKQFDAVNNINNVVLKNPRGCGQCVFSWTWTPGESAGKLCTGGSTAIGQINDPRVPETCAFEAEKYGDCGQQEGGSGQASRLQA